MKDGEHTSLSASLSDLLGDALQDAIEEERGALEIRYAPVLNRKPGECPTRPTLRVIEGGKPAGDDRAED